METPEDELKNLLKQTVNKTPETIIPGAQNATPSPEPVKHHKNFWGNADITEEQVTTAEQPETPTAAATNSGTGAQTQAGATAAQPQSTSSSSRITRDAINNSARTAVATINLAQLTLMRPLLNLRYKKECEKRFGDRLARAQEMIMGDETPTDEAERSLKKRFNKFLLQRDQKITDIPFTETEEQDMEKALKSYFEMKNVTMSPEILLYCSLASTVGKRVVDVVMWD